MNNWNKTLEQLENNFWENPPEFPTGLVERCHHYRKIPVGQLTVEQLRTLISQNIGLEHLLELALKTLKKNILSEGDFYPGDLLVTASSIPNSFWATRPTELSNFKELILSHSQKLREELGENKYNQILVQLSKHANSLNNEFFITLEYHLGVTFEKSGLPELRGFWCDGITPLNPDDNQLTKKYVNDNRKIRTKAWIGKSGQDEYEMIIHFGKYALRRYSKGTDLRDCIPSDDSMEWVDIDFNKRSIHLRLN